ncbi:hypothetical protein D3C83_144140 [compost metagenome]
MSRAQQNTGGGSVDPAHLQLAGLPVLFEVHFLEVTSAAGERDVDRHAQRVRVDVADPERGDPRLLGETPLELLP